MSSDTLSDVLRAVRLQGAVYFLVEAADPWVAEAPPAKAAVAAAVMPGSEHVIEYHVVTRGTCWAGLVDGEAVKLEAGDVIVFPHGDAHAVSSTSGMRAEPDWEAHRRPAAEQLPFFYREGGESADKVQLVCGFLGCDARPFNPLLNTLPPMIHVHGAADDSGLGQFIRLAIDESHQKRAGGGCVLARLSELMFVEVVRRYLESLPEEHTGWLAGLRDRHVGRALSLLHGDPAHPWTLEKLAERAALSRSAGRSLHALRRPAADAVPGPLVDAGGGGAFGRRSRQRRRGGAGSGLRFRSGLQPRVQEGGGAAASNMAEAADDAAGRNDLTAEASPWKPQVRHGRNSADCKFSCRARWLIALLLASFTARQG